MCVGVVSHIQSKLSRAFHAYRGTKLLQNSQNLKRRTMKSTVTSFRGAQETNVMYIYGIPVDIARRLDTGLLMEGDIRQKPGIA